MSKHKQHKQSSQRNKYLMASGGILALIVAVVLIASRPTISTATNLSPSDYQSQFVAANASYLLVDVRTTEEFATGHIHGAVNIPLDALETRLSEIPHNQPVVLYCRSGNRSAVAAQILSQAGYTDIKDLGGINAWTEQGFPIE